MLESEGEWFPCFEKIFVLMCLLQQPSSAVVEISFSQVSYVRYLCGDALKEDNIELRSMLRCNGNCETYEY